VVAVKPRWNHLAEAFASEVHGQWEDTGTISQARCSYTRRLGNRRDDRPDRRDPANNRCFRACHSRFALGWRSVAGASGCSTSPIGGTCSRIGTEPWPASGPTVCRDGQNLRMYATCALSPEWTDCDARPQPGNKLRHHGHDSSTNCLSISRRVFGRPQGHPRRPWDLLGTVARCPARHPDHSLMSEWNHLRGSTTGSTGPTIIAMSWCIAREAVCMRYRGKETRRWCVRSCGISTASTPRERRRRRRGRR